MEQEAYLVLANGKVFKGNAFGAKREVISEVVFTTGMTGYIETLTDKSYFGQAVVQTFPLIGNYGVIPEDFESENIVPNAYIVRQWCHAPSNFRSRGNIDALLKEHGVAGLYGVDTRELTKTIRESGVMNGIITYDPAKVDLEEIRKYRINSSVECVSVKKQQRYFADTNKRTVVLLDYGMKTNITRELLRRECNVIVCPHDTSPQHVVSLAPDGIMLSNGPGDPADNPDLIDNLKMLTKTGIPIFGICLGHQLLALANGFRTEKLKYGHRGANQPVKDNRTGKVYISSQNHGYSVVSGSIDNSKAGEIFVNVNDKTCEGIEYFDFPAFSVQFHPEGCAGPQDTAWLFDRFIRMMEGA